MGLRSEERIAAQTAEGRGHAALGRGSDHDHEDEQDADDDEDRAEGVVSESPRREQERHHDRYLTILTNDSTLRLAPPTRAPSMSSSAISSFTLSGLTEPP